MKKHVWGRALLLLVTVSTLSGCIWVPVDERDRGRGHYGHDEGWHHDHDEHHGDEEGGRR